MKFGIDLGHGIGRDRGAVGIIAEETIINQVGELVISKLESLGHTVLRLRPTNATTVNDSLQQRYTKANNNNVDMCVSIHANAGGGVGAEIFTYKAKEVTEARNVLNNLVSLGFKNRGIKDGSGLAMVKRPSATAMLIEICFIDTQNDVDLYNSVGYEKIANAIVKGLTGQTIESTKYKIGWNENSTGWFYAYDGNNCYYNDWKKINGEWYSFDSQGYARKSCWLQDKGVWYYLKDNCVMAHNEWLWIDGECYCFSSQGVLYVDCITPDGYPVDESGAWIITHRE